MSYTNQTKVEAYLGYALTVSQAAQLSSWITAAQEYIENYTGQKFEAEATTKYYDSKGGTEMLIDSFQSITELSILDTDGNVDETLTEGQSSDFITYPYNETIKYKIVLTVGSSLGAFPVGKRLVKVVATFGVGSTVPKQIELVTAMLVAGIIRAANAKSGGEVRSESLGDYSVSYGEVDEVSQKLGIKQTLDQYKLYSL